MLSERTRDLLNPAITEQTLINCSATSIAGAIRPAADAVWLRRLPGAVDGMRAVADKQAELLQAVIGELGSKIKELTAKGVPSAKTTELVRQTIEKAIAAMRDVAEAAAQPQSAAVEVISTRV